MRKYAKLECDVLQYSELQDIQINNNSITKEQFIGSRKKLYSNNEMIATMSMYNGLQLGGISKSQFNSFLGSFNKQLYKQFLNNNDLYEIDIPFEGASRDKNYEFYDTLSDGQYFYNIDLKSAYWQIAHKLGYLNDKMFHRYFMSDEYKMAKRLCISFLARKNKMVYYKNKSKATIQCNTGVFQKVYDNIRHCLYSTMVDSIKDDTEWLEYNIDGVTVTAKDVKQIQDYFNELDLKFKITECRKIDRSDYFYGTTKRKFKNR